MKNLLFKTRRHARHEWHGFSGAGMSGMAEKPILLKNNSIHAGHAAHAGTFKSFTFWGGIYSPTNERSAP